MIRNESVILRLATQQFVMGFFIDLAFVSSVAIGSTQTPADSKYIRKPAANAVEQEAERYLQVPVAVVNNHPITRRDFITALVIQHPNLLPAKSSVSHMRLDTVSAQTLAAACKEALKYDSRSYNAVIQNMMLLRALEDAARAHQVPVKQAEVDQRLHEHLELRQRAEEIPASNDEEILRQLGTSRQYMEPAYRRTLLIEHLILADLDERLGHPLRPDDFFCSHYLYIAARNDTDTATPAELDTAKARVERLRQAIVNREITFEEAAAQNGDDNTRSLKGNLGPLPRTLMKKELESVLIPLSPGEITPVFRINNGYAIARLDRRGEKLTKEERNVALKRCLSHKKRETEVIYKMLKNVQWQNYLGNTPSVASFAEANHSS